MSDSSLQIAFCPQAHKFLPTMRFSCVLLVAAAALVASTSSLSTEPDQEKRLLRSHKTADIDDTQDEERVGIPIAITATVTMLPCDYVWTRQFSRSVMSIVRPRYAGLLLGKGLKPA
ncbi:hypothetical protein KRP22_006060 [Phytophthora ramorum]|nr:hypothetical protein KRP22_2810 [Phytophthora ramorum]